MQLNWRSFACSVLKCLRTEKYQNLLSVCRSFSQLSASALANRGQVERLVLRVLTIAFLHQSSFASLRQRLILCFANALLSSCMIHQLVCQRLILSFADVLLSISMVHEFLCQRVILSFADTLLSVSLYPRLSQVIPG